MTAKHRVVFYLTRLLTTTEDNIIVTNPYPQAGHGRAGVLRYRLLKLNMHYSVDAYISSCSTCLDPVHCKEMYNGHY